MKHIWVFFSSSSFSRSHLLRTAVNEDCIRVLDTYAYIRVKFAFFFSFVFMQYLWDLINLFSSLFSFFRLHLFQKVVVKNFLCPLSRVKKSGPIERNGEVEDEKKINALLINFLANEWQRVCVCVWNGVIVILAKKKRRKQSQRSSYKWYLVFMFASSTLNVKGSRRTNFKMHWNFSL